MSISPPRRALLLALLAGVPAAAQPASEQRGAANERHLELTADSTRPQPEVRISPGRATTLVFNAPLLPGGVQVEDEHLVTLAVNESRSLVTLLPSDSTPPDKSLSLTVRFADGAVPESVIFRLVPHPRAERQVRVYRQPRSADSYKQEAEQERERAERCEAELARTQAEQPHPEGLVSLFAAELVGQGHGLQEKTLTATTQRPGEILRVKHSFSYRAEHAGRVVVELWVTHTGHQPWTLEGAELMNTQGTRLNVLRVWPSQPISPGDRRQLVVEVEATEKQSRGTFLLELREAGGAGTVTVRGVTFP
ncbi:DUF2381 family protein [Archangium sp.]|uniref:DUF2381 family protein n=1 Tax=Archangium sp. TaxID=1872627 RepID=UPI00286A761C|nr:DUF2381 family protein [Archangium sp.]